MNRSGERPVALEDDRGPGSRGGIVDVDLSVVAVALRTLDGGHLAARVDQRLVDACLRSRPRLERVETIGPGGHGERDLLVRPRDTELIDERRAARVQRHRAAVVGERPGDRADVSVHDLRRAAEVRHLDAPLGRGPALSAQIKLRRSDEQVLPDGRAAERLRGLDCGERVHLAGALLDGWHVQIGRRAREQLADDRRGRRRAVVALPVGLDDERRSAGDERRRLARAAEALQRRRLAGEVRALLVDRGVRAAQCPVRLARRDEVEHAAAHREACRFDRGDLVVQPPVRELVRVLRFLRVVAERRARAGADDRRIT